MSPLELEEEKKKIESMLKHGFIRPLDSPYSTPILFALKKDGSLQFYIDYRWLNKETVKNRYLLPLLEELFSPVGECKGAQQDQSRIRVLADVGKATRCSQNYA